MKWRLDPGQIEVIDDDVAAMYRAMTPAERIAIAFQAQRTARLMLAASIRFQHAEWTDDEVKREVVRRMTRGAI